MGLWKSLFSSGDTIEKVTDAAISTGDKLFFTTEEKADMSLKMREQFIKTLQAYEPFKIAQRILAFWFSFLFGVSFIIGLAATIFNSYVTYQHNKQITTLQEFDSIPKLVTIDIQPLFNLLISFDLGWIMIAIVTFYFLGGSFESLKKKGN